MSAATTLTDGKSPSKILLVICGVIFSCQSHKTDLLSAGFWTAPLRPRGRTPAASGTAAPGQRNCDASIGCSCPTTRSWSRRSPLPPRAGWWWVCGCRSPSSPARTCWPATCPQTPPMPFLRRRPRMPGWAGGALRGTEAAKAAGNTTDTEQETRHGKVSEVCSLACCQADGCGGLRGGGGWLRSARHMRNLKRTWHEKKNFKEEKTPLKNKTKKSDGINTILVCLLTNKNGYRKIEMCSDLKA